MKTRGLAQWFHLYIYPGPILGEHIDDTFVTVLIGIAKLTTMN